MALVLLTVAVSAAALLPQLLGRVAGPESEILSTLRRSEKEPLEVALALEGRTAPVKLLSTRHHFDRITVASEGTRYVASATLDFDGRLGETKVSSLGLERIPFEQKEGQWLPVEGLAPRLVAAVTLLEVRRRAIEVGDWERLSGLGAHSDGGASLTAEDALAYAPSMRERRFQSRAWYLRFEREVVDVREEYRLVGDTPSRPIDADGARSLRLVEGPPGTFQIDGQVF